MLLAERADDRLWWERGFRTKIGRGHHDSRPFEFSSHAIEQYVDRNSVVLHPRTLEVNILSERTFETDFDGIMKLGYFIEPYFRSLPHITYIPDPHFDGTWVVDDATIRNRRLVVTYYSKTSVKNRFFAEQLQGFLQKSGHLPANEADVERLIDMTPMDQTAEADTVLANRKELRQRHGEAIQKWAASRVALERAKREKERELRERLEQRLELASAKPVPQMPVLPKVDWEQRDRVSLRRKIDREKLRRNGDRKIVGTWGSIGEEVWRIGNDDIPFGVMEWYAANPEDQERYWPTAVRDWAKMISHDPNRIWDYLNDELELPKRAAYELLGWKPVDLVSPISSKKVILYLGPDDPMDLETLKIRAEHDFYWTESSYVPASKFNQEQKRFLMQVYEAGEETATAAHNRQQVKRWKEIKEFKLEIKEAERRRKIRQQYEALYPDRLLYQEDPCYVGERIREVAASMAGE